jgi:hypothetical protein
MDIPLAKALLLWDSNLDGSTPAFAVRPLGHADYDRFRFKVGACFRDWQEMAESNPLGLKLKAIIELWHIVAFYGVPVELVHEAMLAVPEYRDMLANDCLPKKYWHERE